MDFHVSRAARDRYGFDEAVFSLHGDVLLVDLPAARQFASAFVAARAGEPEADLVQPGHLHALGLMHEVMHHVIASYAAQHPERGFDAAVEALAERVGDERLDRTLRAFAERFPAPSVHRGDLTPDAYLAGSTEGRAHRGVVLEELLLLWVANQNPAAAPYRELFDDAELKRSSDYTTLTDGLRRVYAEGPPVRDLGTDAPVRDLGDVPTDVRDARDVRTDLVSLLLEPIRAAPDSLIGQLRYIHERWGVAVGTLADRLLLDIGVLGEEERAAWNRFHPAPGGPGAVDAGALHGFAELEPEPERFSADRDWMPRCVIIAKSTYVWLDQLSREYGRTIRTLDAIPDEELDRLARWGFSGLWLIGLWERSPASQRIKQLRGNLDAVASAYSLRDYRISDDLGGEEAYRDLRDRAAARGVRLASDMVPNHMGIDSRWVLDHPDRFISRGDSPYPAYTFTGPDLSDDERVAIHLEDHYYDSTDAAVVFKRVDRSSGEERYIYHGNDGTSFPWNDTAQLDYLRADTREAVVETILEVARRFPIIRFDAAMTLAKKHVERLWFPEPGAVDAIPSRSESAMPKAEFDRLMPTEFWREVVDRVAAEAPDTLLLAEAFWLMEGYFVRTLGMHRVYNSAFMHMMRDERNAEYRAVIRNTLEFDPEILQRYVNFMNNPDERTAVDQFGSGDKYFGVATVMTTMPGLPMFGHGQVEGFTEKYGMEFRRARLEEMPDVDLMARHEREIFPLLHRRDLFAGAREFLLFDFETADGSVDQDVFVYANRSGDERALVVYHNRHAETSGRVRRSVPFSLRTDDGEKRLMTRDLASGLGLSPEADAWLVLHEARSGMEYLRRSVEIHADGLAFDLGAYDCRVFDRMVEVRDTSGRYARLAQALGDRPVPSVEEALRGQLLRPLHDALRGALAVVAVGADPGADAPLAASPVEHGDELVVRLAELAEAARLVGVQGAHEPNAYSVRAARDLRAVLAADDADGDGAVGRARSRPGGATTLAAWVLLRRLTSTEAVPAVLDTWGAADVVRDAAIVAGADPGEAARSVDLVRALLVLAPAPGEIPDPAGSGVVEAGGGAVADDADRDATDATEATGAATPRSPRVDAGEVRGAAAPDPAPGAAVPPATVPHGAAPHGAAPAAIAPDAAAVDSAPGAGEVTRARDADEPLLPPAWDHPAVARSLGHNRYEDREYVDRDRLHGLLDSLIVAAVVDGGVHEAVAVARRLAASAEAAGFVVGGQPFVTGTRG